MTDLILPYKTNGHDTELRYCLRSIEKYLTGVNRLFIIGDKPEWLQQVIHIEAKDEPETKWANKNLFEKIRKGIFAHIIKEEHFNEIIEQVTDSFLYIHDDHFLQQPYEADKFPNYYSTLWEGTGGYLHSTIRNTKMLLGEVNNFDIHCPMPMNKLSFLNSFAGMDWSKDWGYCIKTVYAYNAGIQGEYMPDCKVREGNMRPQIAGRPWFSTDDRNMDQRNIAILQELYPDKSKYEV